MIEWIILVLVILIVLIGFLLLSWYVVVDSSTAHLVVSPNGRMVCSPDEKVQTNGGGAWYFNIPLIRTVRQMDVTTKELVVPQVTWEKSMARYQVESSTKFRITDVMTASETFKDDATLDKQLREVIHANVRAVTKKYSVVEAMEQQQQVSKVIHEMIKDDLSKWGLTLVTFQLVNFGDTDESKIITDISKRREVEIETQTREMNAIRYKDAKIKEAEATEHAMKREIEKDENVAKAEQIKLQNIAKEEKIAEEERFRVVQVQQIKKAEIEKEKAEIEAKQKKEVEEIIKDQKELEGQGDRLKLEEQAKGEAAIIKEEGLAQAKALEEKQKALSKFDENSVRALIAEQVVNMQEKVGIASAKALETADLRVFAGGDESKPGFDMGKLLTSVSVANPNLESSLLNKIARPNELLNLGGGLPIQEPLKKLPKTKSPKAKE